MGGRGPRRFVIGGVVAVLVVVMAGCQTPPLDPPPPQPVDTVDVGGQTVTVRVPSTMTVDVEVADPTGLPPVPAGSLAPLGALDITVTGVGVGAAAQLTIELETPVDGVKKLIGGVWDDFAPDGTTGASLSADGRTITLDLLDGGRGDADGTANGVIVDPVLPVVDAAVEILTARTDVMAVGSPYALQLEASGPDPSAITWSLLQGWLPSGLTLDPSGLVSGTPSAPLAIARVAATDGTTTDTKLLLFAASPGTSSVASTGAALPDGDEVVFVDPGATPPYSSTLWRHSSSGSAAAFDDVGIADLNSYFGGTTNAPVDPTGTRVAMNISGSSGRLDIVDADTGEVVVNIVDDPSFSSSGTEFSANGSYLVVKGGTALVFDTSTGALVREVVENGFPNWATDQELAFTVDSTVYFRDATQPALDRSIELPSGCSGVRAFSAVSGRMATSCGYVLTTVSMADGSDARGVTSGCVATTCTITGTPRFSPSGTHLVFTAGSYAAAPLVVAPDEAGATLTALTADLPVVLPTRWD